MLLFFVVFVVVFVGLFVVVVVVFVFFGLFVWVFFGFFFWGGGFGGVVTFVGVLFIYLLNSNKFICVCFNTVIVYY